MIWISWEKNQSLQEITSKILAKFDPVVKKEKPDLVLVHGDTTTTFADTSSQVEINGIIYSTGTVEYSEDGLIEKYKKDLYRHRKMRW